jgi:AcrR family transcriptional regulator
MSPTSAGSATSAEPPAKRGRGRPPHTAAAIERRRQQIIEAAYEIFADQGYHATGIADIAARLDIGHGTFYRYFDNKRDILDHVVDHGLTRFFTAVVTEGFSVPKTKDEFREQMTELGNRLFTGVAEEDPRLARMILLEASSIDAELLHRILGMLDTIATMIAPMLADGVRRGFLRADLDVNSAAKALTGCMIAALLGMVRSPMTTAERARYVDTVVSMICDNTAPTARKAAAKKPARKAPQARPARAKKPAAS